MARSKESIEKELSDRKNHLSKFEATLEEKKVPKERFKKIPKWRQLNSKIRKNAKRLQAIEKKVALAATLGQPKVKEE